MTKAELYELVIKQMQMIHQFQQDDLTRSYEGIRADWMKKSEDVRYLTQQIEQYQKRIAEHEGMNRLTEEFCPEPMLKGK